MIRDIQEALSRLTWVFRRRMLDQDFNDEFAAQIDLLTEKNERRGLPHDEARRQAILQMGGLNATKNLHREARGLPPVERFLESMNAFGRDLVDAVRSLAKARTFTFVCVTSLGIGMGTVIGVLLLIRSFGPPAGFNPKEMVELLVTERGLAPAADDAIETWSYPDFANVRDADTGMTITGWTVGDSVFQLPKGGSKRVPTMFVSANYFRTVEAPQTRGAGFDATVDESGANPVVIISHDFWSNLANSDPDILGKTILLNRIPYVVAGIVPDGFHGHLNHDAAPSANLWIPLSQHPRLRADESLRFNREMAWVRIHGRLSSGVSIERANAALSGIVSGLAKQYPGSNGVKAASVAPYFALGAHPNTRSRFIRLQAFFLGIAGMVLLVICLNISGMVLVRGATRERELSIRQAIGATRARLIRYLLSGALVLAALAGFLASAILLGVPNIGASWLFGKPLPPHLQPDAPMIAMCAGLCLLTSLMFGLLPAIRFSRPSLVEALKDEVGGGSRRVGRMHRLAAAVQVGLAVPFLAAGGVLLDHVHTTATAQLGFEPKGLIAAPLELEGAADTDERAAVLLRSAQENLAQARGISSVALADGLPLDFQSRVIRVSRLDDSTPAFVRPTRVNDGFLKTMGIPLVRGRGFNTDDRAGAEPVAIITEPLAAQLFPNSEALGQRVSFPVEDGKAKVVKIVGVIPDLVGSQMSNPRQQMLLPLAQHPTSRMFFVARSAKGSGLAAQAPAFRTALRDFNPNFDATSLVTGEKLVRESIADMYGQSGLAAAAGGVALTLAALGVYGIIGFMVVMRTREMAVRIALGASNQRVMRTILKDVVKLVAPGVAIGLIIAIFAVRVSYLSWYSLGGVEPLVYTVAVAIAIGVALLASLVPARRAASVEPMVAMRSE